MLPVQDERNLAALAAIVYQAGGRIEVPLSLVQDCYGAGKGLMIYVSSDQQNLITELVDGKGEARVLASVRAIKEENIRREKLPTDPNFIFDPTLKEK